MPPLAARCHDLHGSERADLKFLVSHIQGSPAGYELGSSDLGGLRRVQVGRMLLAKAAAARALGRRTLLRLSPRAAGVLGRKSRQRRARDARKRAAASWGECGDPVNFAENLLLQLFRRQC